jgi:hypothetical protein
MRRACTEGIIVGGDFDQFVRIYGFVAVAAEHIDADSILGLESE